MRSSSVSTNDALSTGNAGPEAKARTVMTASCGHSPQVFVLVLLFNYSNERPDTMFGPLALTDRTRRLRGFHGNHPPRAAESGGHGSLLNAYSRRHFC